MTRAESFSSVSLHDDRLEAQAPAPSSRPFAERNRDAVALLKKRQTLRTQAGKIRQSLAELDKLTGGNEDLWDKHHAAGRVRIFNIVGAVVASASIMCFLGGIGGAVGAVQNTRERSQVRQILETGGVEANKARLRTKLADITAQLESVKERLQNN